MDYAHISASGIQYGGYLKGVDCVSSLPVRLPARQAGRTQTGVSSHIAGYFGQW